MNFLKKIEAKYPKSKKAEDEDDSYILYTTGKRDLQLGDQYKAFKKLVKETEGSFRKEVDAKYAIVEKIKSFVKSKLKKAAFALVGLGLFTAAAPQAMAEPKAEAQAKKYAAAIQQILDEEGTGLTIQAHAVRKGNVYHMVIKIIDNEDKTQYAIIDVSKLDGKITSHEQVTLKTSKKPGDLDYEVDVWSKEIADTWVKGMGKSN